MRSLARRDGVSDGAVVLMMLARFVDELLSGVLFVLVPVLRTTFNLSLAQIGLLNQVLEYVALPTDPIASSLIDVTRRNRLLAFGAAGIATSMILMAFSQSIWWLMAAFGAYGLGGGALCETADVVITESHPDDPSRAFARQACPARQAL